MTAHFFMPELPEVETIANDLRSQNLEGAEIVETKVFWKRTIASPSIEEFCEKISGKKILKIGRKGKYLLLEIENGFTLAIHLKMSGRFFLVPRRQKTRHEHVGFFLKDGRALFFHDTRKFGKMHLLKSTESFFDNLGPDPTDKAFTWEKFQERLKGKSARLKKLLLDQSFVCGLGNIYVDEALWEAKLHPERKSSNLNLNQQRALFEAIKKVLNQGIDNGGTSLGHGKGNFHSLEKRGTNQNFLKVYKKENSPCERCGYPITRLVIASRGTHICPSCQK